MPTDPLAFGNAHFGSGAGPIHLENVACSGSERNLIDCHRSSFVNCYTWRGGAAVRCQGTVTIWTIIVACPNTLCVSCQACIAQYLSCLTVVHLSVSVSYILEDPYLAL